MTEFEPSGQPWRDDPAAALVDTLYASISEELGTDGPAETFGHPDSDLVGHIVEEGMEAPKQHTDVLALDSHDVEDLSAEELAMHYVDEDSQTRAELDDLPGYLR